MSKNGKSSRRNNFLEAVADDLEDEVEDAEDDVEDAVLLELNSRLANKLVLRGDMLERLCVNGRSIMLKLLDIKRLLIWFKEVVNIASSSKKSTHKPQGIYVWVNAFLIDSWIS
jgi:hypothetical protein